MPSNWLNIGRKAVKIVTNPACAICPVSLIINLVPTNQPKALLNFDSRQLLQGRTESEPHNHEEAEIYKMNICFNSHIGVKVDNRQS